MTTPQARNQPQKSEVEYEFVDEFDEMLEWEDDTEPAPELSALAQRAFQHRFD